MEDLCREQSLTDVTITCGDVSLEAHSLILGASSPILRSILAKGEGKKQTLHFMDMNPYHMQLLLQYMYRGEISVPQIELAPLMASARSLQVKGLCSTGPGGQQPGSSCGVNANSLNIIDPPAISLPPPTPSVHTHATPPTVPTGMFVLLRILLCILRFHQKECCICTRTYCCHVVLVSRLQWRLLDETLILLSL